MGEKLTFEVMRDEITGALEIRTPLDGDVDGDTGAWLTVGGELIAVITDSALAEEAAALIAAAPAMYEALKALSDQFEAYRRSNGSHADAHNLLVRYPLWAAVNAALRAADGALGASTPGADGEAGSTGSSPGPIPTEGREPNQ